MHNYEEKILTMLVELYRKSKKDSGTGIINRRTQIKPTKLYAGYNRNDGDLDEINGINEAAAGLQEKGFLIYEILEPKDIQTRIIGKRGMKAFEHINYVQAVMKKNG